MEVGPEMRCFSDRGFLDLAIKKKRSYTYSAFFFLINTFSGKQLWQEMGELEMQKIV